VSHGTSGEAAERLGEEKVGVTAGIITTGHSSQTKPRQACMKPAQIKSLAILPNQSQDKPA